MIKTLYRRLSAILLAIFLIVGVLFVLLMLFVTRMHMQEAAQKLNHNLAEYLVSEKLFIEGGKINQKALKDSFKMLMHINPSIELYLLDAEGNIMAYSAPPDKVKRKKVSTKPIEHFLGDSKALPIVGDDPRNIYGRKVFSVATVPKDGPVEGYLYIILGGEEFDSVSGMFRKSYILRLSILGSVAGLVFALLAGLFLFGLLTRRLHRLSAEMEGFERSGFREPTTLPVTPEGQRGDEIAKLEMIFVQMSNQIIQQMDRIIKADSLRRELVSHISHDLRTPLTSLQGYLETVLLKGEAMSAEDKKEHLEIAFKHSKRLGRLVSELFYLAKLDSASTKVQYEAFNIGELALDIIQKNRLAAENKKISLQADITGEMPFVSADIGLIERAIQNLIDNAILWTGDGGIITISIATVERDVILRVSDTGRGIRKEDIPNIFDSFYKIKDMASTEGSGLGLAITARILELHESHVEVESELGEGTTFTFRLPVYEPGR